MNVRLNYGRVAYIVDKVMDALDTYLATCGLKESLVHLVQPRASDIKNGVRRLPGQCTGEICYLSASPSSVCIPWAPGRRSARITGARAGSARMDGGRDARSPPACASDADYAVARSQFSEKELAVFPRWSWRRSTPGKSAVDRRSAHSRHYSARQGGSVITAASAAAEGNPGRAADDSSGRFLGEQRLGRSRDLPTRRVAHFSRRRPHLS